MICPMCETEINEGTKCFVCGRLARESSFLRSMLGTRRWKLDRRERKQKRRVKNYE